MLPCHVDDLCASDSSSRVAALQRVGSLTLDQGRREGTVTGRGATVRTLAEWTEKTLWGVLVQAAAAAPAGAALDEDREVPRCGSWRSGSSGRAQMDVHAGVGGAACPADQCSPSTLSRFPRHCS